MGGYALKELEFIQISSVPCKVDQGDYMVDGWVLFGLTEHGEVFRLEKGQSNWLPLPTTRKVWDLSMPERVPENE